VYPFWNNLFYNIGILDSSTKTAWRSKMGFWYILALVAGIILYIKFTFFNKQYNWRFAISMQLQIIGIALFGFGIFMLLPISNRLIDILFQ
jgi:hypothetical protein